MPNSIRLGNATEQMQPLVQVSNRNSHQISSADLGVVYGGGNVEVRSAAERQTAFPGIALVLGWIAFNHHGLMEYAI